MKVLVTGASGLLGRALMLELRTWSGCEVIGAAFSRIRDGLMSLNLLDEGDVFNCVRDIQPDVVIHSAAERRPDVSERDPAGTVALNLGATETIVRSAKEAGAWVLFMSTNYVFDGSSPPYSPDAETHPLNLYGESKVQAERALWRESDNSIVLRLPTLYGPVESLSECSVTTIADQIRNGEREFDHWAIRFPTYVNDVAKVCIQILSFRIGHSSFCGTYHWSSDEALTKYEMARVMSDFMGADPDQLDAVLDPPPGALRPKNCQLDCSDLLELGIGNRTPFAVGISEALESHRGDLKAS